jgi:hypothetical protein
MKVYGAPPDAEIEDPGPPQSTLLPPSLVSQVLSSGFSAPPPPAPPGPASGHAVPPTSRGPSVADGEHPTGAVARPVDRPLHEGSRTGERGLVSLFLSKGAGVNSRAGACEGTALHYAAGAGHVMVVEFLLARGADATAQDNQGLTPADWAKAMGHDTIAKLLSQS